MTDGNSAEASHLGRLGPEIARLLRADLKGALADVVSGRGSFAALLHQVERVAKYAKSNPNASLERAKSRLGSLVRHCAPSLFHDTGFRGMGWNRLYREAKDARNDIAHTGTEAVLAERRATALATVLLEALRNLARGDGVTQLKHVMVENPVCAHPCQTVADVRRTMLTNDFSVLPMRHKGCWYTVTADSLAEYLAEDRDGRLGQSICEAWKEFCGLCEPAHTAQESDPARKRCRTLPVIVVNGPLAVGIVTSFDLL